MVRPLTRRTLLVAIRELAETDPALAASRHRFAPPPLRAPDPSFATLVHLILEQQVSLASAKAAFERLGAALAGDVVASGFLQRSGAGVPAIWVRRPSAPRRRGPETSCPAASSSSRTRSSARSGSAARRRATRGISRPRSPTGS